MKLRMFTLTALLLFAASVDAQQPVRRALLIGIDDYSASTLPRRPNPHRDRGWPDLKGAVNDVRILEELLVLLYGFERKNIVTLTNQQATRAAILQSIERHLVAPAKKGDVVFYYFAGHGSQVPNAASDEPDRLDESIVPADSRWGAADIRDKELRPLFNRILDRGAHLTLLLDHCYSGSGFRGLPNGARPRGIGAALPIVDGKRYGPRPDERGALVLASTQDLDLAYEKKGDDGLSHGGFTWAWIRAMRDAAADEPAQETFLRAQARLRDETPYQAPAMLGSDAARLRPFLGTRIDRRGERAIVAVERVDSSEQIVLQGGWAHGLTVGTQLRASGTAAPRLRITKLLGLGRSIARLESGRTVPRTIRSGALLEVAGWAAPPGRPLRVWTPRTARDVRPVARRFAAATKAKWIVDPLDAALTHLLRPRGSGWELLAHNGTATPLANDDAAAAAIARLGASASLFVQLPFSGALAIDDAVVATDDPTAADYILAGRFDGRRVEYAWLRPLVRNEERAASGLPRRTAWSSEPARLRRDVLTLRRIHAWHTLQPPPGTPAPYRLAVRRNATRELVRGRTVTGKEAHSIVLRASQPLAAQITPRYYYVFVIDSHGRSHLVFPRTGSVENRFPLKDPAPAKIDLGDASAFEVTEPYGLDTYVLLSTDEPLPNPSILAWDGVRAPAWSKPLTPLEELLLLTITGARATRMLVPSRWSIERLTLESVAPPRRR